MTTKKSFKDLIVWQKAVDLVPLVYQAIQAFPKIENYALTDQIRRSVVSIPSNIAEGQSRQYPKEFLQFLWIAKGSLAELQTQLIVAKRLGYLNETELTKLEGHMNDVARLLNGLIKSLSN